MTQMNISMKQKQTTDIENRPVVPRGRRGWGGMDWECGISIFKLVYIGWINNKILLYSTGNYIQHCCDKP